MSAWSVAEGFTLLDFLWDERHAAGTFNNPDAFPDAFWNEAVRTLPLKTGVQRSTSSYKNKWRVMRETYATISEINSHFGWENQKGANIGPDSAKKWERFLGSHKLAAPFRQKGWVYLNEMKPLMEFLSSEADLAAEVASPGPLQQRRLIPEVVIGQQRTHVMPQTPLRPIKPNVHEPKLPKAELKEESKDIISLVTPPPKASRVDDDANGLDVAYGISARQPPPVVVPTGTLRKRHAPDAYAIKSLSSAKRPRVSNSYSYQTGSTSVLTANDRFDESSGVASADNRVFTEPPQIRMTQAIKRAQVLETHLSDKCIVGLIDIFQNNIVAADAYLSLTREGVRKQWVENRVKDIREEEEEEDLLR